MRTIETDAIRTAGGNLNHAVRQEFKADIYVPPQTGEKPGSQTYNGTVRYYARQNSLVVPTDILVVPTQQNMQALARSVGSAFGIIVPDGRGGQQLRPAVVTARSTAQQLDLICLTSPLALRGTDADFDQINPLRPIVDPLWPMLLKQAAVVQDRRVGASHDPRQPAGRELGHIVLATVALKKPDVLNAGHAVHGWTAGQNGIAGTVTGGDRKDARTLALYDFKLSNGTRSVEEATMRVTAAETNFLLKIPELDRAMQDFADVPAADLTAGMGLVAVQSQLDVSPNVLHGGLLENIRRL